MKRLESHCVDHRNYTMAADEFTSWLSATQDKMAVLSSTSGSKEDLENRLTRIRVSYPNQCSPLPACACELLVVFFLLDRNYRQLSIMVMAD